MMLAYIDPGAGALVWQMVVSAFVGVFFYLKKTRTWIVKTSLGIFRGKPAKTTLAEADSPDAKARASEMPIPAQRNSTC